MSPFAVIDPEASKSALSASSLTPIAVRCSLRGRTSALPLGQDCHHNGHRDNGIDYCCPAQRRDLIHDRMRGRIHFVRVVPIGLHTVRSHYADPKLKPYEVLATASSPRQFVTEKDRALSLREAKLEWQ
jgi:hypothetical protein